MKLLVFAHTPPPHHGQSYMVEQMLTGFGGDWRRTRHQGASPFGIECYHVNARLSKDLEDIGSFRLFKFLLLAWFCLQAILVRFRYGVTSFYYVPAPGKRSALYRDWLVMWLCRRFFKRIILHWHAAGLGKWLETAVQFRTRATTYALLGHVDQSIVLSEYNTADATKLFPRSVTVVHNGVPDPCPEFDDAVLPRRKARTLARARLLAGSNEQGAPDAGTGRICVLYLAHCTGEKGLFEAIEGVLQAGRRCVQEGSPLRLEFWVAGTFFREEERRRFDDLIRRAPAHTQIHYHGFVSGHEKARLLREADVFCFPTHFPNENQPVNLIEAMAFGLPLVTTRWRSLPEMLPKSYPGLVDVHSPEQTATALLSLAAQDCAAQLRQRFLDHYVLNRHLEKLADAIRQSDETGKPEH